MSDDFLDLERTARRLCESRNGPGSWDTKGRKRNTYRAQARRRVDTSGLAVADALMAIFGLTRRTR